MPVTRRSSRGGRSAGKQATLTFNHRVTKSVPKSVKDAASTPSVKSPLAKHVVLAEPDDAEEEEEEEAQAEELEQVVPEREKTEAELRAAKITDRQIGKYWRGIENERRTKRLHQADLSMAEKILRYWDVSSQYGPCIGITRVKRWERAERLGLNPPIEVLAVLIKEEEKGTKNIETAHMDDILNSTTAGAD